MHSLGGRGEGDWGTYHEKKGIEGFYHEKKGIEMSITDIQ